MRIFQALKPKPKIPYWKQFVEPGPKYISWQAVYANFCNKKQKLLQERQKAQIENPARTTYKVLENAVFKYEFPPNAENYFIYDKEGQVIAPLLVVAELAQKALKKGLHALNGKERTLIKAALQLAIPEILEQKGATLMEEEQWRVDPLTRNRATDFKGLVAKYAAAFWNTTARESLKTTNSL